MIHSSVSLSPGVCRCLFNLPSDSGTDLCCPRWQADCRQESRVNSYLLRCHVSNGWQQLLWFSGTFFILLRPHNFWSVKKKVTVTTRSSITYSAVNHIFWVTILVVRIPYLNALPFFFLCLHIRVIAGLACNSVNQRDFLDSFTYVHVYERGREHMCLVISVNLVFHIFPYCCSVFSHPKLYLHVKEHTSWYVDESFLPVLNGVLVD